MYSGSLVAVCSHCRYYLTMFEAGLEYISRVEDEEESNGGKGKQKEERGDDNDEDTEEEYEII